MLIAYQQQTRRLLNDQRFAEYNDFDLREYVNQARRQIALDSGALRNPANLPTVINRVSYSFSEFVPIASVIAAPLGLGDIVMVRSAQLVTLTGVQKIDVRSWEYFNAYYLERPVVSTGEPQVLAQQLLGAGVGSVWLYPVPDAVYNIRIYPVYMPIDLVDDATAEALPRPWTDAVPYYAAYLAFMSIQNGDGAKMMWDQYNTFERRANRQVTGTQVQSNFPLFRDTDSGTEGQGGQRR